MLNLPKEHAPHRPVFSASLVHRVWPSNRGIMRFSIVAPKWLSRPCHKPDVLVVSAMNTTLATCVVFLQFSTFGTMLGLCLKLSASDSMRALWLRLASGSMHNLFRTPKLVEGTWSQSTVQDHGLDATHRQGHGLSMLRGD